jgi:hypothetical protein
MGVPRTLACVIFSSQHEAATMLVHADKKWATVNEINSSHHQRAGVAEVYFPVRRTITSESHRWCLCLGLMLELPVAMQQ